MAALITNVERWAREMAAGGGQARRRWTNLLTALSDDTFGTVGTNVTAVERVGGGNHTTVLTLASVAYTIGDNVSLADGALIYTFPTGPIVIHAANIAVGLTLTTGTPTTDTPEVGLGTVIGTGAVATLGGTPTFEDILGPAVMDDVAGTIENLTGGQFRHLAIEAADAHTVHLNIADAWANVDNTAATMSGTVVLNWGLLL